MGIMFGGEKMAGIKEAFCIFERKKRSFDPLKFYLTVQELKKKKSNKLLKTRWSRFRWCNFFAEYPEKL